MFSVFKRRKFFSKLDHSVQIFARRYDFRTFFWRSVIRNRLGPQTNKEYFICGNKSEV